VRTAAGPRRALWTTAVVGAGAVAALVSGGLMLTSRAQPPELAATTGLTSPPTASTRSIVRLDVSSASARHYGCGVVVGTGGLVATDASLLTGATSVMATTSSGRRERATVVAVDPISDVGLVRLGASLPVARFVDWSDVQPGTDALELALTTVSSGPHPMWRDETISSIGEPVGSGPGSGMVSVLADTPAGVTPDGAVLMERDGSVVGLLDPSGASADGTGAFLPGEFVFQVAHELMTHGGQIDHGWLGIQGSDPPSPKEKGALVTEVDATGPASGHLQTGDLIEWIDGRRVRSMADLRSRLYLLAPGSWVTLGVQRDGIEHTLGLTLGTSP
jgi:serine protease Do